jgi:hypothetical protein
MRRPISFVAVGLLGPLLSPATVMSQAHSAVVVPSVVTMTDFNGDGFADLPIGVIAEGSAGYSGAVSVLYGSDGGLQADAPDDQLWSQNSPGVKDRSEGLDYFGSALAPADFNADGFTDLAIGASHEAAGDSDPQNAGAVNVLYGSPLGLQAGAPDDQFWTQDSPGVKNVAEFPDYFGTALASADFNGDGFADLAIGSLDEYIKASDQGAVSVLYGSNTGLQADAPDDQFWTEDSPGVKDEGEVFDQFGGSLAASDFNADGFSDLAIGSGESVIGHDSAGAVSVLYGSAGGLQASAPDDQFWTQNSPGVKDRSQDQDHFGYALAAGDFNADGFPDLAISEPKFGSVPTPGALSVLYGSVQGLQADDPDDQLFSQDSPGVKGESEAGDNFGWSLAAGDFNADGFMDLALGDPEDKVFGIGAGAANVLFGSALGLQADSPDDQLWSQTSPGVKGRGEEGDSFGEAVAAGDFNADGFSDLAVGVEDDRVFDVVSAGAVNVLYGSAQGLQANDPDDQHWDQGRKGVGGKVGRDLFGGALA